MHEITHRVGIKASPEKIYQLLTTNSGLCQWWTNDVAGAGDVGSIIKFRFNGGGPDFLVSKLIANKVVAWKHSGAVPEAWIGTEIVFNLTQEDEQTFVGFTRKPRWPAMNKGGRGRMVLSRRQRCRSPVRRFSWLFLPTWF